MAGATSGNCVGFGASTDSSASGLGFTGDQWAGRDPWNRVYSGTYKIVGQTTSNGVPVSRWVHLFAQNALSAMIGSYYTAADGNFAFMGIAPGNYLALGVDPSGAQNAVVYDFVAAASM